MIPDRRISKRSVLSTDTRFSILDTRSANPLLTTTKVDRCFCRIEHRASSIEHRASSIEHRASSIEYRVSSIGFSESAGRFSVLTNVSTSSTSTSTLFGEEPPRGSLNPGDSYLKVGIMVGIIGRSILDGSRNSAHTRWACRQPLRPSGLSRSETSRDSRLITTWRYIHTQSACQIFMTFGGVRGVQMAHYGSEVSV